MTTSDRNAALAEIERQIIEREGAYYVGGRYFAVEPWRARRIAAERILAERERQRTIRRRHARERKEREQLQAVTV